MEEQNKEKNVIITGSNRGIGLAIVRKFAENGWNIWACARKPNTEFEAEMSELAQAYNIWIKPVYFDMASEEEIKKGFKEIFADKKSIHTLINNAGIGYRRLFQMSPMDDITKLFQVNVFSVMTLSQLVLKIMAKQKQGNIINIASTAGLTTYFGNSCYGSSKAAIISFSKTLAAEVASYGIRVNAIAPGPTDTDLMNVGVSDELRQDALNNSAMHRMAHPYEIANVAYFLSNEESFFINGQVIRVDGGGGYER